MGINQNTLFFTFLKNIYDNHIWFVYFKLAFNAFSITYQNMLGQVPLQHGHIKWCD